MLTKLRRRIGIWIFRRRRIKAYIRARRTRLRAPETAPKSSRTIYVIVHGTWGRKAEQTWAAAEALQGIGTGAPNVDVDEGRIRVPVGNEGAEALRDSSRRLDEQKIKLSGFAVHRPTLDDVFMALTGHAAEDGSGPEPEPAEKRSRRSRKESV